MIIYILKGYRKKSSSILLRKNMFNSLFAFFSEKHAPSQVLKNLRVKNLQSVTNYLRLTLVFM